MKRTRFYIFILVLALVGYAWVLWIALSGGGNSTSVPEVCLFRAVTHLPCPSCGTTRAIGLLLRGDPGGSLMTNPFGIIDALALLLVPLWAIADLLRRRDSLFRCYNSFESFVVGRKWITSVAVALVAINWIWNIRKGL